MKKTIIFLSLACLFLSCKAQILQVEHIIPVQEQVTYMNNEVEVPDNTYYKDFDNDLGRLVVSGDSLMVLKPSE